MNVDSESVCLAKGGVPDILNNGDVDGGKSARAVDFFGCHVCGCVNIVVLIWTRGLKVETSPRKSHVDAPASFHFHAGMPIPARTQSKPYSRSAYPTFRVKSISRDPGISSFSESISSRHSCNNRHNHENRRYGPRGQVPRRRQDPSEMARSRKGKEPAKATSRAAFTDSCSTTTNAPPPTSHSSILSRFRTLGSSRLTRLTTAAQPITP